MLTALCGAPLALASDVNPLVLSPVRLSGSVIADNNDHDGWMDPAKRSSCVCV